MQVRHFVAEEKPALQLQVATVLKDREDAVGV
jgi:hypothetical protein